MVSFIRLSVRRKVDLPQPDGPMKAVTIFRGDIDRHVGRWPASRHKRHSRFARNLGVSVMFLPAGFELVAQVDGEAVHRQQECQQHDDRRGRVLDEA
jgi:hypothetical protein